MRQLLLDTNIVIYLLKRNPHVAVWLEKFRDYTFVISIISWIEALAGSFHHGTDINTLENELSNFICLPLHATAAKKTAGLLQENIKKGKKKTFQDCVIAATAMTYDIPLFTNNPNDFRNFKGLKVISPQAQKIAPRAFFRYTRAKE